jgi:hypothetical protein
MGRVKIEIDGTKYDIDEGSEEELLQYLGMNAEVNKKKRFQFAQKVISSAVPAIKTGVGFLAGATQKAVSVEHSHEEHRAPHYQDSFERSAEHQANKEAECADHFGDGIAKQFAMMERGEEEHNAFNEYFERNMGELYESRRQLKKIKLRKKKMLKRALNE